MRSLSWKVGLACITFFTGTVLALTLSKLENKKIENGMAQSPPPETEVIAPEYKISEPPSSIAPTVKSTLIKKESSVRYIKSGGKFCENYLLKKIAKVKSADSLTANLKKFNPHDETLSPNLKKWLEYMREDILLAAELRSSEQKALLLGSESYGATGLATSLENWHVEINGVYSGEFWSFSKNPNLVFWDKDGLLNYYSVIYSDDFLSVTSDRDYNNLTFNIERHKIIEGKDQLMTEEQNLKCE